MSNSPCDAKAIRLAVLALMVLALIWSYNWILMKSVLRYVGALDFTALRCAFGALVLMVMLPLTGRSLKPPPWRPVLWIGLLQTAGMGGLGQLALVAGGAGKTAVLVYTMPFWVILLAALFLNEKPRLPQYAAVLIAAFGLLLVIQPWEWHGTLLSSLLAVGSGLAWAGGTIVAKRAFRHQSVDLLSLLAWQMVVGAIVLSTLALATHKTEIVWSPTMLLVLGYNAVLSTALAWALWLFILRTLPTGVAGLSSLIIPVMSVLWAWWLLGERPDLAEGSGIALILLALALLGGLGSLRTALRRFFDSHRPPASGHR
ncbi:DMT family transporter [Azonexus sp.]|uniref:DMT family transporter n=1 Tax=Azonexus sp. TaxID=1872668 RepID=UPI00283AAF5C|nr:DMT family transporter [Azonexus sp.]